MTLRLKDIVYRVRTQIGELEEFNWSNNQIITDANWAAQEMSSTAGMLTRYDKLILQNVPQGTAQEAALDFEVDRVKKCGYFQGQLFNLDPGDWKMLQQGASTGSIPRWYYLKTSTRQLTPQSTGSSNIVELPIPGPGNGAYRTVLGVWPIPPQPAEIHVWYSYFHPWMSQPESPCEVPARFLRGLAAYVISQCLTISKAYGEAKYWDDEFQKYKEEYRIYASQMKQQDRPNRYGGRIEPWRQNPSSSVIIVDPYPSGP